MKVKKEDKVVKHMKSFKKLLDHNKENKVISKKAHNALMEDTEALIQQWK